MTGLEVQEKLREMTGNQQITVVKNPNNGKYIFSGDLGTDEVSGMKLRHYIATFLLMILTGSLVYVFN